MGKSKKAWKQIEDLDRDKIVANDNPEATAEHLSNSNIFFVDAKGNAGGMQDLKRRKKRELEDASLPSGKEQKMADVVMIDPSSLSAPSTVAAPQSRQSDPQVSRWKKRHAAWVATKKANQQDEKERKLNLDQAGLKFDPNTELHDIWAENQNPEKGVQLEKARNKGFEVDVTPMEVRKRVYMRPRDKKHVEKAKEHVDPTGTKVAPSGASFNPDEDERQAALQVAYDIDQKERADKAKLHEQLNPPSNIVENALPEEDDESALFPSKKAAKAKTKAQRNAKMRQIQEEYEKEKEKTQAKLGKQIDRLGSILSEVKNEEKKSKSKRDALAKLKEHPDKRPKISKHAFVPAFPTVPLTSELSKQRSMRETKPSAHLLREQFKRFQEKNVIETRVKVSGKKGRMKAYTRKTHRDPNDTFPCKASKT